MKKVDWRETRKHLLNLNKNMVLISAHRGKFGSSIIENTTASFNIAIGQGTDMVEIDVMPTKDRVIVGWHDDDILRLTHKEGFLKDIHYADLRKMELFTSFQENNNTFVETFDEIAKSLKDKSILVIDKAWDCWDEVYEILVKYDMVEQALFKFYIRDTHLLNDISKYKGVMLIPMSYRAEELQAIIELKKENLFVGIEILPEDIESPMLRKSYIDEVHSNGMLVWCNSLSYSNDIVYGAGYNDELSLKNGGDAGWGKLVSYGVNIIQTDWIYEVRQYLEEKNLRQG